MNEQNVVEEATTDASVPVPSEPRVDIPTQAAVDPEAVIPGTKLTYAEAERFDVPEDLVRAIPEFAKQARPRRLGIVTNGDDWFLYRSLGRREFKLLVDETTNRTMKNAEAAEKAGKPMAQTSLMADTQNYMEERIAAAATLWPKLSMAEMGNYDAGLPKLLHDSIMMRSSFDQNAQPIAI